MTFASHLWHPMLVHFAVALLVTSLLLFAAAFLFRDRSVGASALSAAWWNLWLGAGAIVLTVASGLLAYTEIGAHNEGAHAAMEAHRNWAFATALPFLALAAWSVRMRRERVALPFVAALAAATVMLGVTGWKGGSLVYDHGVGVAALEKVLLSTRGADAHGHDDDHTQAAEPAEEVDDVHIHPDGAAHGH